MDCTPIGNTIHYSTAYTSAVCFQDLIAPQFSTNLAAGLMIARQIAQDSNLPDKLAYQLATWHKASAAKIMMYSDLGPTQLIGSECSAGSG